MFLSFILSTYQNTKYHNKHMVKICSFGIRRKILGNRKHNLLIQIQKKQSDQECVDIYNNIAIHGKHCCLCNYIDATLKMLNPEKL